MRRAKNGKRYGKNERAISRTGAYAEIGDFWEKHDLSDYEK
jgi:hypothetical protein